LMEPPTLFREHILMLSELVTWCLKQPSFAWQGFVSKFRDTGFWSDKAPN
jgi:hypothetical protein